MKNYLLWQWGRIKDWWNDTPKDWESPSIYLRYQELNKSWFIDGTPSAWVPAGCYIMDRLYYDPPVSCEETTRITFIESEEVPCSRGEVKYYNSRGELCVAGSPEEIENERK